MNYTDELILNQTNDDFWQIYAEIHDEEQEYYPGFGYAEDIDILY